MSVHHRAAPGTESDAVYYQPVSQDEVGLNGQPSPAFGVEEDEEALAEEFLAQEHVAGHDKRIYWIHVILGSAVLLPWNGEHCICEQTKRSSNADASL